jgi:hypothetical protein
MDSLIDEAWRTFEQSKNDEVVVSPSIPILFFGDSERYLRSPLRVITVGLNPSRKEFPDHDRSARVRSASQIDPRLYGDARPHYLAALNGYFRNAPYRDWFGWYEQVLLGLGASYYDGEPSTALHTDLCSPLATDPTWTPLGRLQERFEAAGMALRYRLVTWLSPDVIVVSVAKRYRDQIVFADPCEWRPFITLPRKMEGRRPFTAWGQSACLPSGATTHLLFGQAAQQPFATLDKGEKSTGDEAELQRRPDAGAGRLGVQRHQP